VFSRTNCRCLLLVTRKEDVAAHRQYLIFCAQKVAGVLLVWEVQEFVRVLYVLDGSGLVERAGWIATPKPSGGSEICSLRLHCYHRFLVWL